MSIIFVQSARPVARSDKAPPPVPTQDPAILCEIFADVAPGAGYRLHASLTDIADGAKSNAALVSVAFLNAEAAVLPGPYIGLSYSRKLDHHFAYLPAGINRRKTGKTAIMQAPEGAVRARIAVRRWAGTEALKLHGTPRLAVHDYTVADLEALESSCVASALTATRLTLDERLDDPAMLLYALGLAERAGLGGMMREVADRLIKVDGAAGKDIRRAQQVKAVLLEMDPDWLPHLPIPESASGAAPASSRASSPSPAATAAARPVRRPRKLRIVHLCGDGSRSGVAAATAHTLAHRQNGEGLRAVMVTPNEYIDCVAPAGPWTLSDSDGVPHYRLDCLATSAAREIERTRLLQLDALLCARIAGVERAHVIHAHTGIRGYDLALRGLAAARAAGIPLVYDYLAPGDRPQYGQGDDGPSGAGEMEQARRLQEIRCMIDAAAVMVRHAREKALLVEQGVNAEKIFVAELEPAPTMPAAAAGRSKARRKASADEAAPHGADPYRALYDYALGTGR